MGNSRIWNNHHLAEFADISWLLCVERELIFN